MKRELNGTVVIDASSEEEMYELLGIAHATDRGLQMLIMRILGKGRAAELLEGSDEMVEVDKFFRKLNWRNCTDELKKFSLSASEDTVTSKSSISEVPPEFKLKIESVEVSTTIASLLENSSTWMLDKVSEPVFSNCI